MVGQCQNMLGYCRHLTLGQQHNFCVGPSSYKHVGTLVGQSQNMLGYSTFTLAQCKNSLGLRWAAVGIQHRVNDDFFVGSLSCIYVSSVMAQCKKSLAQRLPNVVMDRSDFGTFSFISLKKKAKIQSIVHILQYNNIHSTSILRTYVATMKQKYSI